MQNTKDTLRKQKQYNHPNNEEPVFYCEHCLSLRVLSINQSDDSLFCDDCGSSSIDTANIIDWENMYKNKYNKSYLKNY